MPNRLVREGILSSHRVCALGWGAEVFYRRLLNVVDDFGRYYAEPVLLRSACYPLQIDKVKDADVQAWLSDAQVAKLLHIYEIDGKKFLQVIDFRQQIRAQKSKFPAPESGTEVSVQGAAQTHSAKAKAKANGKHPIGDWKPTEDEMARIAERYKRTPAQMAAYFTELRDYCARTGSQYADYLAAYRTAVRGDWGGHAK